jgi:two-component system, sensor histidine kinase
MDEDTVPAHDDRAELDALRARLAEAEETLRAIREGEVDALLIVDAAGERVYTLRSADAPYRALVEQMQGGAVTVSSDGDIIYCNRYFAALVDAPLQQVIGVPIGQFVDVDDQATLKSLIAGGGGKVRTRLRSRGGPVDVSISVSTVTVDDTRHRTLIVTDLSTLTKVQRENRSKDEFLAMLAHELRNPLGAIGGAVQVLALTRLREPRAVRAREVIQRQVLNMARLVDDLLDVGRVVTGKIVLDRHPVDLADAVRSCVAGVMSNETVERSLEVDVESVWVLADAVRLEQIVGNLVFNALKFTPPDRFVRVSVNVQGSDAVLRVADEGMGITPDVLPHVFDLFVRADVATDRSKGGLGIGLTLVRRLVELHGGTVEAESKGKGHGSTFTVRLPAAASPRTATIDRPSRARPPSKRVLLVEDHADAREMYSIVLRAAGHKVYEAEDGPEALTVVRNTRLDVAIVDIGLPGMDGYELAREIRSAPEGRDVTLIALTGYGLPDDRERSGAAGFDRHLVKPVAPDDLQQAMESTHQARNA